MSTNEATPLSSPQQVIWLDQVLALDPPCYNVGGALQFDGRIRLDLWEHAIADVVRRNDALRLVLVDQAPAAGQKVLDELAFKLDVQDNSGYADGEQRAWDHIRAAFAKPFALRYPLHRPEHAAVQVVWEIERAEFSRMTAIGESPGGSITHVLIGALAIHFSRITGNRPEVVIGMPVHNRKKVADKRTVGMFSSMLPLSVAVHTHASFEDTIRSLVAQSKACYRHQRFPLYEIVRHARKHSPRQRLFDLGVSVEQFPGDFVIEGGHIAMVTQHNG